MSLHDEWLQKAWDAGEVVYDDLDTGLELRTHTYKERQMAPIYVIGKFDLKAHYAQAGIITMTICKYEGELFVTQLSTMSQAALLDIINSPSR